MLKKDFKFSSAKLVYGTPLKVSSDVSLLSTSISSSDNLALPWLKEKIDVYQPQQMSRYSQNTALVPKFCMIASSSVMS